MIPTASNYPDDLDTDLNLHVVHDSLRMTLADDYNPGDTSIVVDGDETIMSRFPSTGIITLTDQCDEVGLRAISFYYGSKTISTFDDLEILPGFEDVVKPKGFTHVTMNVMASHHNNLKDALIAVEEFVGVKGSIDTMPYGNTLEGRINFLRKLVFTPKAWFKVVGTNVGLVPLSVVFEDQSYRLGSGDVVYLWDFGDSTASIISTSNISACGISAISCIGIDTCSIISKTYCNPGKFDVTLTVSNIYGSDSVTFYDLINPRIEAPDNAVVNFATNVNQVYTPGTPTGGPYTTPPKLRSSVDDFVDVEIPSGTNPNTDKSFGGEWLGPTGTPLDPITTYTWSFGDDLTHSNQATARAMYSIGGLYDLVLRTDTSFGAYRITKYEQAIDMVENTNLWVWTFGPNDDGLTGSITANEFGLVSEVFKTSQSSATVYRDDSFLDSIQWQILSSDVITQAKQEFKRNVAFSPRGTSSSGSRTGNCLMYYASGGVAESALTDQTVNIIQYYTLTDVYDSTHTSLNRPWNWVFLGGNSENYFLMGQGDNAIPGTNPSYQVKTTYDLTSFTSTETTLTDSNYKNGAQDLMQHISIYDDTTGFPTNGWFAVYRSTWKNSTGYFLRNDAVGTFFRIKGFYKTEGTVIEDVANIKKLPDMEGPTKLEGQLVPLTSGVFFFNNSGNISAYNDTTGIWETGGPSADSIAFHSVQDTTIEGYNSGWNTLLATSDNDYAAYLSYDYSPNAFIKFNAQDLTFTLLQARPSGSQFTMGIY